MAKSRKRSANNGRMSRDDWKKNLVNVDFSYDDQQEFLKWADTSVFEIQSKLNELIDDGWKISLCYSSHFDCYLISATDKEAGTDFSGKTMTVRHANYDRLIPLIVYAIEVLLENGHPDFATDRSNLDW